MESRASLVRELFPDGIPTLWCPLFTHFTEKGEIDRERIRAHLRFMRLYVPALLVPGSTSEEWELGRAQEADLIDLALECAREMGFSILIGILRSAIGAAKMGVEQAIALLFGGARPSLADFRARRLCGFAVTAPKGKNLPQATIYQELEAVLKLGYPTAFYQLPQITENEIGPKTVA